MIVGKIAELQDKNMPIPDQVNVYRFKYFIISFLELETKLVYLYIP